MNEHQKETSFLRQIIRYEDSDERLKLEQSIAQVQHDQRCVQGVASVTVLFPVLAIACLAAGDILQDSIPALGSELATKILCEVVLSSLICLIIFASLLAGYRKKLNRLREECRQLVTRLLESHLGKPHIPMLAARQARRERAEFTADEPEGRERDFTLQEAV
jgi:hypothetical protein